MSSPNSKHVIIKNILIDRMKEGIYREGEKLPSEAQLCEEFSASRSTVRKALDELAVENFIYREQGLGSFVERGNRIHVTFKDHPVVMIFPFVPNGFLSTLFASAVDAAQHVAVKANYRFVAIAETEDTELLIDNVRRMEPCGILTLCYSNALRDGLMELGLPTVHVDSVYDRETFDIVTGEDYLAAYRAGQLLCGAGCQEIGYYSQFDDSFGSSFDRYRGIKDSVRDFFGTDDHFISCRERVRLDRLKNAVVGFLKEHPKLDGLLIMNDNVWIELYRAAHELGIRIPEDLKVISFGNYVDAGLMNVTSFDQHFDEYGRIAMELLVQRMEGQLPPIQQKRSVSYELMRKDTF